jgi:DNA-binding NarL/FixJ family response regulator
LNPALLTYLVDEPPIRPVRRRDRRHERLISKRLDPEQIERLVAEYAAGTPSAELGHRYRIAKSSVLRLIRQAGKNVRYPRMTADQTAHLLELYRAGLPQKDIAERLGRSPGAIWHCLRRLRLV